MTTALRSGILLLLCLTTAFCGSHDEDEIAHHADRIERRIPDVHAIRVVAGPSIVAGTTAGTLPGTSEVTPTGQFTYRIDLDVPPGRMEPTLSLKYASHSGNGLLGVGWRLDGFSEIHRCAKTFAQDGKADGIDFDEDNLCLDGRKLVAITSGGNEYRTEQDSMSRIIARGSNAEPDSFVVYRKDGRILEYSLVTRTKLVYLLSAERDRAGNEIRYEYHVTAQEATWPRAIEYYPSAVHYTFRQSTTGTAQRKVVFRYEDRPDPTFAYIAAVKLSTTKRLTAIEMHAPNPTDTALVWRYTFGYTADTVRSQLASVKKCGALGGCLLAKEFVYQKHGSARFQRAYEADEPFEGDARIVFDADGDGKDELLYQGIGKRFYLRKSSPDGKAPLSLRMLVRGDESFAKISLIDTKPVDIDADGVPELTGLVAEKEHRFFRWHDATKEFRTVWAPIAVSEDAHWGKCKVWPRPEPAHFGDLNGDSLPDMVKPIDMEQAAGSYKPVWHYWLNRGDSFAPPVPIARRIYPAACYDDARRSSSISLDLRGEHRATVLVPTLLEHYYKPELMAIRFDDEGKIPHPEFEVPEPHKWVFADLNGDGLADRVIELDGKLMVWWNTARDFIRNDVPLWTVAKDIEGEWQVADIDRDGDDDLLVMKGGRKPALVIFRYVPGRDHEATMQWITDLPPGRLGDFNGDGFLDVVSVTDGHDLQVFEQVAVSHGLLKSILDENSDVPREEIQYQSSDASRQPGRSTCRYPQRCIHHNIPVVRKHSRAHLGARVYSYEAPRSDLRGRGFLGFGKVHVWDPDRGTEITTTYDHETRVRETYPYALLPKEVLEVTPILEQPAPGQALPQPATARARIKKRVNGYQTKSLHNDHTYFVHPESWTSWEWEQDLGIDWKEDSPVHIEVPGNAARRMVLRTRTGTYRVDDYDNVLEETVVTEGGVKRTVVSTYEIREPDWLVGLVHRREVASDSSAPRKVEYAYDDRGLLTQSKIEPDHLDPDIPETITYTRSPDDGLVSAITRQAPGQPPRTVTVDFGDGERVFPLRIRNTLNHAVQLAYHSAYGTLETSLDANGVRTRQVHDDLGRLRSVVRDGEAAVTVTYAGAPGGTRITFDDAAGGERFVEVDLWDRPVVSAHRGFDGEWIEQRTEYDVLGNLSSETRPGRGAPADAHTAYRYDSLDRLLEIVRPDGARTKYRHTFLESRTWDAKNHESYVVRDADDRIIRSVQFLGSTELPTTYQYREFGLIEKITDPKGNVIKYDYDERGRRTRLNHPDRGVTTYLYNGYGELRQTTDALNHVAGYDRDLLGRITRVENADGVTELVWDGSDKGIGNLSTTTSPDGTRRDYHYDRAGRPERLDWTVDGERFSIDTTYDALGRLSTLAYPQTPGRPRLTVRRTYNAAGYLNELSDVSGSAVRSLWRVDSRNPDDALTQGTYGNGLTIDRTYNDLTGRLKELNAGAVYGIAYDYYANGLVKSRTDSVAVRRETFAYDSLDRLQSWQLEAGGATQDTKYNFDDLGNLMKVLANGQVTEENQYGGSGAGPHALTASSLYGSFGYDAKGRRTNGGGKQIQYTELDLPRQITTSSGLTSFAYDATGTRVKKAGPGGTTISIGGLYERRTDPSGTKHIFYIEGSDGIVAQIAYDQGSGKSKTQYILTDVIGSVGVVTDETGREIERRYFEPFGQRIEGNGAPLLSSATDVRIGFTGHLHDGELGLIDMGGRVYDPATRRFLTADPTVLLPLFGQAYNAYAYALNSPLSITDPSGYSPSGWRDEGGEWWSGWIPIPIPWFGGTVPGPSGPGSSAGADRWQIPGRTLPPAGPVRSVPPPMQRPLPSAPVDVSIDTGSRQLLQLAQHVSDEGKAENYDEWQAALDEDIDWVAQSPLSLLPPIALATELYRLQRALDTGDSAGITESLFSVALLAVTKGRGLRAAAGGAKAFAGLSRAAEFGIQPYSALQSGLKGTGLHGHHLIEKRFAQVMGQDARQMLSVAVTKAEHEAFTKTWRQLIPYGKSTGPTRAEVLSAARKVYAGHPEILKALGL